MVEPRSLSKSETEVGVVTVRQILTMLDTPAAAVDFLHVIKQFPAVIQFTSS